LRPPVAALRRLADRLPPERWDAFATMLAGDERQGARAVAASLAHRAAALRQRAQRAKELEDFDLSFGSGVVAGCDEVGRGALAGPLVAAAVILRPGVPILGLDDSKRLSRAQREQLAPRVMQAARAWAVVSIHPRVIDRDGVGRANLRALVEAAGRLRHPFDLLLVDAFTLPEPCPRHVAVVGGDGRSRSIAAASVLAKVVRDRMMEDLGENVAPGYGIERHVGYGCKEHFSALLAMGPTPIHRRSFLAWLDDPSE